MSYCGGKLVIRDSGKVPESSRTTGTSNCESKVWCRSWGFPLSRSFYYTINSPSYLITPVPSTGKRGCVHRTTIRPVEWRGPNKGVDSFTPPTLLAVGTPRVTTSDPTTPDLSLKKEEARPTTVY